MKNEKRFGAVVVGIAAIIGLDMYGRFVRKEPTNLFGQVTQQISSRNQSRLYKYQKCEIKFKFIKTNRETTLP